MTLEAKNLNEQISNLKEYEVILHKNIEEVDSEGWFLKHKKTGARIVLLANDDDNKVFNIGFRTPVNNDTGVPHIIEHTVLCGSKKYPVKDPFMELVKGSLNTFLNAMTYPDKTIYPVASYNEKDFKNLMETYMDAVFNPNIYDEKKIFLQEGWHYELENKDGELTYNGVVYNEMKGVYSSVDGVMDRATLHSLYPDTSYSYESGGNPDNIPELSYEEYLDFHRKYYHPSNSYIYLYGDMDMVERLQWIDKEYLGKYDMLKIDSEVKKQPAFSQLKEEKVAYAITDSESLEDNTVLTVNYVIGDSSDVELNTAIQVLEYVLMEMPGAFLKQALIDAKIGKDVYSQYEDDICQPMYSIVAKYANESDKEKFITIINETLEKLAKEGLDKKALLAGLNSLEFKVRESDFGRIPKGLIFGINMLSSWLYDDSNPFVLLETNKVFEKLRKMIDTDYFEKLITEYFIKNTHKSVVILTPEKGLTEKKEQQLKDSLEAKKGTMTDEEIENIIRETKELKEYQTTSSSPEDLAKIPLLKIEDIGKEPRKIIGQPETKDGITMLYNDLFTNGIGYLDIVFDCTDLPEKYQSYMGLLKPVLSYMDTEKHSYTELNTEIDLDLGGFAFDSGIYVNKKTGEPMLTGEVHAKMLYDKIPKTFDLIKEVVLETKFDDYKRLKEILEELKSRVKSSIIKTGDSAAMLRAMSYYSKSYYLKEQSTGLAFYQFLSDILDNYEEKKEDFAKNLKDTIEYVFSNQKMYLNYAGDKESYELVKKLVIDLKNSVYNVPRNKDLWQFKPEKKNEAIKTSGQVQYVARTGNYNKDNDKVFSGSFMVLGNIMRSKYLWNNIRELGGAYGCNASFTRNGDVMFTSYRDPNLGKTNQVYLKAADFIENFNVDEREMRKYIIGTISGIDTPLNAADRSGREFSCFITDTDYETLKREREQILSTNVENIRELAPLVREAMADNNICVVGSASAIEQDKELFEKIVELV